MNGIEKLIGFIEVVLTSENRYSHSKYEDSQGRAVFLDHNKRIMVAVGVSEISVTRYHEDTGEIELETIVNWESLTMRQKQKIIDLLESSEKDTSETNDILLKIFS